MVRPVSPRPAASEIEPKSGPATSSAAKATRNRAIRASVSQSRVRLLRTNVAERRVPLIASSARIAAPTAPDAVSSENSRPNPRRLPAPPPRNTWLRALSIVSTAVPGAASRRVSMIDS